MKSEIVSFILEQSAKGKMKRDMLPLLLVTCRQCQRLMKGKMLQIFTERVNHLAVLTCIRRMHRDFIKKLILSHGDIYS